MITPVQGRLLVELRGEFDHIEAVKGQFDDTKTRGIVRAIAKDIVKQCADFENPILNGKTVYFAKFEDNAPCEYEGHEATLIKLEEIGGVE